jgi:putative membrane fusion protein
MGRAEGRLQQLLREYRTAEDESLALTHEFAALEQRVIVQRDFLKGLEVGLAAPKAGVVCLELDGLEQSVTPRQILEMSTARLENLTPRPSRAREGQEVRVATPLFKVIDPDEVYIALVVSVSEGESFSENMEVRFTDFGSQSVLASLHHRGAPELGGKLLVVLRASPAPDELAGMRQAAVEVILGRWHGPVVDRRALIEREGDVGLMVVTDSTARFHRVEVLGGDERQAVVRGIEMGQEIVLNPWLVREGMRIR